MRYLVLEVMVEGQLGREGGRGGSSSARGSYCARLTYVHPVSAIAHSQAVCLSVPGHGCAGWGTLRSQDA